MVAFVAFYEWGFGATSHRFLRSLVQYMGSRWLSDLNWNEFKKEFQDLK
jgi:hypothetical protein